MLAKLYLIKKSAFALSAILTLAVTVMASTVLINGITDENTVYGILGAISCTLPLITYCIAILRVRRGWYLVAAISNGVFLALAVVVTLLILMNAPSMMMNLLLGLLVLIAPLALNLFALSRMRKSDPRLMPQSRNPAVAGEKSEEGLRGWLILVGFGVVLSPIFIATTIYKVSAEVFYSDVWEALTSPDGAAYHALWAPLVISEFVANSALILAWGYIAFLFFSKRRIFPFWFIAAHVATVFIIVIDTMAVHFILPETPRFDPDTLQNFLRPIVALSIWAPYMLMGASNNLDSPTLGKMTSSRTRHSRPR